MKYFFYFHIINIYNYIYLTLLVVNTNPIAAGHAASRDAEFAKDLLSLSFTVF